MGGNEHAGLFPKQPELDEDLPDDGAADDALDADEAAELERRALVVEKQADIERCFYTLRGHNLRFS